MYKNLRDLFKNKYAINDENKPYGVINDRSLIITQRAPQAVLILFFNRRNHAEKKILKRPLTRLTWS